MITDLTTSMLYICPECSTTSLRTLSAFEIKKKDGLSLRCSNKECRYDDVIIYQSKDKYKITIDCPVCGDEHHFTLSQKTIWGKDFLILNCSQSGFGILFIGKDIERLKNEYSAQSEVVAGIIANNDELYDRLDILFELVELINSYVLNNAICCSCGNNDIMINIDECSVKLTCQSCGKSVSFDAEPKTLERISESDKIIIE